MERIDRTQVRRVKTDEQETDFAFWQSRTPQERLPRWKLSEGSTTSGNMELNQAFNEFSES
jgi:hypothetical protein